MILGRWYGIVVAGMTSMIHDRHIGRPYYSYSGRNYALFAFCSLQVGFALSSGRHGPIVIIGRCTITRIDIDSWVPQSIAVLIIGEGGLLPCAGKNMGEYSHKWLPEHWQACADSARIGFDHTPYGGGNRIPLWQI